MVCGECEGNGVVCVVCGECQGNREEYVWCVVSVRVTE